MPFPGLLRVEPDVINGNTVACARIILPDHGELKGLVIRAACGPGTDVDIAIIGSSSVGVTR